MTKLKNIKKKITIGLIALFIGLAMSPIIDGNPVLKIEKNQKEKISLPVEIAFLQPNEITTKETHDLVIEDIKILEDLIKTLNSITTTNKISDLFDTIISLFENNAGILNLLPNLRTGPVILSIGNEKHFLIKYLPKIKTNELFHIWHYSSEWSTTLILFKQLSQSPIKILHGRQIGFMFGFRGIYIYVPKAYVNIPDLNPDSEEICIFLGSAIFAGGIAI